MICSDTANISYDKLIIIFSYDDLVYYDFFNQVQVTYQASLSSFNIYIYYNILLSW